MWLVLVMAVLEFEGADVRVFPVKMPSGARYWTVLDESLTVVPAADAFLRQVRFGRDGSELTTRAYAGGIALYLRWCVRSGRDWRSGATDFGMFILWLRHAGPPVSGVEAAAWAQVLPARGCGRCGAPAGSTPCSRRCVGSSLTR